MKVVAPTISSPVCQEQLIEAGKLVAKSVEGCVEASQGATNDEGLLKQVGVAASGVTQALNELLQHIKQYGSGGHPIGRHGEATDRILDVTENIFSSMGDAGWFWIRTQRASLSSRQKINLGFLLHVTHQVRWFVRLVSSPRQPPTWSMPSKWTQRASQTWRTPANCCQRPNCWLMPLPRWWKQQRSGVGLGLNDF